MKNETISALDLCVAMIQFEHEYFCRPSYLHISKNNYETLKKKSAEIGAQHSDIKMMGMKIVPDAECDTTMFVCKDSERNSTQEKMRIKQVPGQLTLLIRIWKGHYPFNIDLDGCVAIIRREEEPEDLIIIVRNIHDLDTNSWITDGKKYTTYQQAYAALGAEIDKAERNPF